MATWCSGLFWAVGCPTIFSTMDLVLIDICVQTPRDCGDYLSEFRHCKSLWNRFHHYYAYGTIPSCHQWKEDYNNCKEWEKHKTLKAKVDTGTLLCFHTQKYYFILCIPSSWADCISDFYHLLDRMWKRQCNILNTVISLTLLQNNFCFHYFLQDALQMSERNRVEEQRKFTPVWTMRQDPPSDWHMPLTQEKPQDPWTIFLLYGLKKWL